MVVEGVRVSDEAVKEQADGSIVEDPDTGAVVTAGDVTTAGPCCCNPCGGPDYPYEDADEAKCVVPEDREIPRPKEYLFVLEDLTDACHSMDGVDFVDTDPPTENGNNTYRSWFLSPAFLNGTYTVSEAAGYELLLGEDDNPIPANGTDAYYFHSTAGTYSNFGDPPCEVTDHGGGNETTKFLFTRFKVRMGVTEGSGDNLLAWVRVFAFGLSADIDQIQVFYSAVEFCCTGGASNTNYHDRDGAYTYTTGYGFPGPTVSTRTPNLPGGETPGDVYGQTGGSFTVQPGPP